MTRYANLFEAIPLDTDDISQALLDIDHKTRSNPLKWSGQFTPQLVNVLIGKYGSKSSQVFDPFLGSGTVLLECGRIGVNACGSELNPAAVILAKTYEFINVTHTNRKQVIDDTSLLFEKKFPITFGLDGNTKESANHAITHLTELHQNLDSYLSKILVEALIILIDFHKVENLTLHKIFKTWNKLKQHIFELPFNVKQIAVYHSDARSTPLADSTIDFVITSPPYINVFNYHQQYRQSAEALNWQLLDIAKSEFGSNRKHRGNRFLTVTQYCLDIAHTLNELIRVSTDSSQLIFILGRESMVCGTPFYNSAIFMNLAYKLNFSITMRQERRFKNRFGKHIIEDIIHLQPPVKQTIQANKINKIARGIAIEALQDSLQIAPEKSWLNLEQAIARVGSVNPSPLFSHS